MYVALIVCLWYFFFFQAEDGIRDDLVTGVQTCALPISRKKGSRGSDPRPPSPTVRPRGAGGRSPGFLFCVGVEPDRERLSAPFQCPLPEIGRASCRERV